MTKLQCWMDANKITDAVLASKVKISRVHVSRIRRGLNGTSKNTALKLEKLTGIPWLSFITAAQ